MCRSIGENGKELLGVFETYRRPDAIFRAVHEARLVVLLGAVGGGLLLYVSLFAIMHHAARKIDEQQENLLQMQSELAASQRMAVVGEMAALWPTASAIRCRRFAPRLRWHCSTPRAPTDLAKTAR